MAKSIHATFPPSPQLDALREAASQNFRKPYTNGKGAEPGCWLVKDSGLYLMVPGKTKKSRNVTHCVEFPEGTHISGDDFAQFVPFKTLGQAGQGLSIRVSPRSIQVTVTK